MVGAWNVDSNECNFLNLPLSFSFLVAARGDIEGFEGFKGSRVSNLLRPPLPFFLVFSFIQIFFGCSLTS